MPNQTLTDHLIRAFTPPKDGTVTHWDAALKGFGIRISQGGAKTFIVLIGSGRRQSIGRYPTIKLAEARTEAKKLLAEKTLGKVRPTHTAFDDAKADYLEELDKKNRASTMSEKRRHLASHYPFGRTSIASVTTRDVLRNLRKLSDRPGEHNGAFRVGRAFFRWCVRQRLIDRSPLENVQAPPTSPSRERVLSDDEIAAVYRIAIDGDDSFHRIVALLILTGQRRTEISRLQWSWIKDATITLPSSITKNKRTHRFPISDGALAVLATTPRLDKNLYVFPAARDKFKNKPATVFNGWAKPKERFDEELAERGFVVAHWTLHDLRRTLSSGMAALHIEEKVVEKLLNHISDTKSSAIAKVYNRYEYFEEMREAVQRWNAKVQALLSNEEGHDGGQHDTHRDPGVHNEAA